MQLARSVSENSYFLRPRITKVDRRNYVVLKERGLPSACLFVASLSNTKTPSELYDSVYNSFKDFGVILNVKVHIDQKQRPFAFVQFKRETDAKNAMKTLKNSWLDGRMIRIERAKVFREIEILVPHWIDAQSVQIAGAVYGEIQNVRCVSEPNGFTRAWIKYAYREDACEAMVDLTARYNWKIKWANRPQACSIVVGNLHESVSQEMMTEALHQYGNVKNVIMFDPPKGSSNKYCFATYADEKEAMDAIAALNGLEWLNQVLFAGLKNEQVFH